MNLVFVQGKIVSKVEFDFILNGKNISISIFKIKLLNKSEVIVKAYNELADFCYRELKNNDNVFIEGYLNSKLEIIITNMY